MRLKTGTAVDDGDMSDYFSDDEYENDGNCRDEEGAYKLLASLF